MTRATITVEPIEGRARGVVRRGVIVTLALGDRVAHGEASPLPGRSRESLDDVLRAIAGLGGDLDLDLALPFAAIDPALPPSLRFALESAAWRLAEPSLPHDVASQLLVDDVRSFDPARASEAHALKIKIKDVEDATHLRAIRAHAPSARLRVDANRAFADARSVPWALLADAGVEWIEEPTHDAHVLVRMPVPIALDETVEDDPDAALDAVRAGRVAALVLKPTMLGLARVIALSDVAHAHGVRAIVSHAFESDVGLRAARALAHRIAPSECHGLATWDGLASFHPREVPHALVG